MKETKYKNYYVTKDGRVFSKNRNYPEGMKEIKPNYKNSGYMNSIVSIDGKVKHPRIHRLVAEAFIPNPENKPFVNHIDGNKHNNHVSNLEWVTAKENHTHALANGLTKDVSGENHHNSKLTQEQVYEMRKEYSKLSDKERLNYRGRFSKKYRISKVQVTNIVKNRSWK